THPESGGGIKNFVCGSSAEPPASRGSVGLPGKMASAAPGARFCAHVLEQLKKYCSHSGTVLFVSGFVLARSQAAAGMLPRQSLARTKKSSFRTATLFL